MAVLRSDIERALDDLISNEEGMKFQGLAVVLAKKKWPDLIASERKRDLGADAIAKAPFAADGLGKVLACSTTATLKKVRGDAEKIKKHFKGITKLVFATPAIVSNERGEVWAAEIQKDFGYELAIMEREEIVTSLGEPSNASLLRAHLGLATEVEPSVAELVDKVRAAAAEVTAAWSKRTKGQHLMRLRAHRLDPEGRDSSDVLDLSYIEAALIKSRRLVLEGSAGRGKTTTLIQLAQAHREAGGTALLISLPDWTGSGIGILQFIAGMPQFLALALTTENLALAINEEHFSFLLNGWNEIGASEFAQAEIALRGLERDFPTVGIIVATRTHHIVPPLPGALRARLLTLTRRERTSYLKARLGSRTDELRQKLDADPALDELTRTPFILSEVTSLFEADESIPSTKVGVLDAVTRLVEQSDEHRNQLQDFPLAGRARDYLGELATRMTAQGGVSLSENHARAAVAFAGTLLKNASQIATSPEPAMVLSALCAHHVLERQDYPVVAFRFQHQQFQEFYASVSVGTLLWEVLRIGTAEKGREFTSLYVNEPAWAESLRMIAGDLGGRAEGAERANAIHVGKLLIEMALTVDPIFAAELSRLCGATVWNEVGTTVGQRLRSLYGVPDARYRHAALAGMLASGSEDFKDIIVPILSGENQQDRLGTYRMWTEFHVSSLGSNWLETVRHWNEQARVEFVSELLRHRNVLEVWSFARSDASVKVKEAAIEALSWIGAEEESAQLLESLDDNAFGSVIHKIHVELIPPVARNRALAALKKSFEASVDPIVRLRILLKESELGVQELAPQLKEELSKVSGRIDDHDSYFVIRPTLDIVRATDALWASAWVAERVADGSLWHETWNTLITAVPERLREALISRLESEDFAHAHFGNIIAVISATADVAIAERIFLRLCNLRAIITGAPDERHAFEWAIERQLDALLTAIPANVAIAGVSSRFSGDVDGIELDVITRVFSSVGRSDQDLRAELNDEVREKFRTYLKSAVAFALQQDDFSGELKANVASALASVGTAEDMTYMRELIGADIERVRRGRAAWVCGDRGKLGNGGMHSYAGWHVRAVVKLDPANSDAVLLELLNEQEYERDVAVELARLVAPSKAEEGFIRKVDYERIWEARLGVREEPQEERRKRYASAIRARIDAVLRERIRAEDKRPFEFRLRTLALALARIDSHGSVNLVFEVMSFPDEGDNEPRLSAAETLLFNGVALPTTRMLSLLDAALDRCRKYGVQQQDGWLVRRFLCLLPFVDDPARGIQRMRDLISELRFYDYELRDVVEALGHCRCDDALPFLRELASDKVRAEQLGDAWINAVAAVDSPDSRTLLLSFVDPELHGLPPEVEFRTDDVLAARIGELVRHDKAVEQRLLRLCEADLPAAKRLLLAKVIGQLGNVEAVSAGLNLIDDSVSPSVPYEICNQIEAAFVEKRPHAGSENTYTLAPRSSNAIRTKLLEMASKDEGRKKSAFTLLAQIEEWRLEYGRPTGEPRHPAFETGEPWPPMPE